MMDTQGSNMWATGPSKSATGHAMLFINPHQPFFGSAFPTIGHNEHLGWSYTVNKPDVFDVCEETFDKPGNPLAYRYAGGYREAAAWSDTISVKTDQGIVRAPTRC